MSREPTGHDRVRVGRLSPPEAMLLCRAAEQAGLACLRVDLEDCADKACLLARLARDLGFPDWFGHNWDALGDCVDDLGWHPAQGYLLILERAEALAAADPEALDVALEILREAAADWATRGIPMPVYVDLEASTPDAGFPTDSLSG